MESKAAEARTGLALEVAAVTMIAILDMLLLIMTPGREDLHGWLNGLAAAGVVFIVWRLVCDARDKLALFNSKVQRHQARIALFNSGLAKHRRWLAFVRSLDGRRVTDADLVELNRLTDEVTQATYGERARRMRAADIDGVVERYREEHNNRAGLALRAVPLPARGGLGAAAGEGRGAQAAAASNNGAGRLLEFTRRVRVDRPTRALAFLSSLGSAIVQQLTDADRAAIDALCAEPDQAAYAERCQRMAADYQQRYRPADNNRIALGLRAALLPDHARAGPGAAEGDAHVPGALNNRAGLGLRAPPLPANVPAAPGAAGGEGLGAQAAAALDNRAGLGRRVDAVHFPGYVPGMVLVVPGAADGEGRGAQAAAALNNRAWLAPHAAPPLVVPGRAGIAGDGDIGAHFAGAFDDGDGLALLAAARADVRAGPGAAGGEGRGAQAAQAAAALDNGLFLPGFEPWPPAGVRIMTVNGIRIAVRVAAEAEERDGLVAPGTP